MLGPLRQQRFDLSPELVWNSPAVILRHESHARAHATRRRPWKSFSRRIVGNGPTWSRWTYRPIEIGSKAYGDLKRRLVVECAGDIDAYVEGKTGFIVAVLRQVGLAEASLSDIEVMNRKQRNSAG